MLKNSTVITKEDYYERDDYISNSDISRFVTFDLFGNPTYNVFNFINRTKFSNSSMVIGTAVDEVLTEGLILANKYGEKLDKAWLTEACTLMWIDTTPKDTIAVLQQKLAQAGFKDDKISLPKGDMDTIYTIIDRAHTFQYDATRTFDAYREQCQTQLILTNDNRKFRGKFDFYHPVDNRISDLKTTGNLEKLLKDLMYKWSVNINHKYVRQLAFYQQLAMHQLGTKPTCELIIIDHSGNHIVIRIGQKALDKAWEQIERDLLVLERMLQSNSFALEVDFNEAVLPDDSVMEEDEEEDTPTPYPDMV